METIACLIYKLGYGECPDGEAGSGMAAGCGVSRVRGDAAVGILGEPSVSLRSS